MSFSDWQRWCNETHSLELSSKLAKVDGLSIASISVYAAAAAVAAFFGWRWLKLHPLSKAVLWPGFKWYLTAMAIGCACGCVRQALLWRALVNQELLYDNGYMDFNPDRNSDALQAAELHSEINKYWAPQQLLLSFEKLFITYADFQILHYKVQLLLAAETVREKRIRFTKLLNWSQVALVLVNIVHFALNCHSAVLNVAAMNHFLKSAQAFRSGRTATGARLFQESLELYNDPSDYYQGISLWIEAVITLSVVVAFAVVGVWALRAIHHTERLLSLVEMRISEENSQSKRIADLAISKGKRMRRRVEIVLHLMLAAYIFRAVFECMHAFAYTGVDRYSDGCGVCDACQNMATIMSNWFETNPQVQVMASVIAGPVALLLALYGMKAGSILRLGVLDHSHGTLKQSQDSIGDK